MLDKTHLKFMSGQLHKKKKQATTKEDNRDMILVVFLMVAVSLASMVKSLGKCFAYAATNQSKISNVSEYINICETGDRILHPQNTI